MKEVIIKNLKDLFVSVGILVAVFVFFQLCRVSVAYYKSRIKVDEVDFTINVEDIIPDGSNGDFEPFPSDDLQEID